MQRGKMIVIEGIDAAGKQTQTAMLVETLRAEGRSVETLSFPLYEEPAGAPVKELLRGTQFGPASGVGPRPASTIFAVSMFGGRKRILEWLEAGTHVVCDRYVWSNYAHQGAMVPEKDLKAFFDWLDVMHFGDFQMPRPDITIVLDIPSEIAQRRVALRKGVEPDGYEKDMPRLRGARTIYQAGLTKQFSMAEGRSEMISCMYGRAELGKAEIAQRIRACLGDLLS